MRPEDIRAKWEDPNERGFELTDITIDYPILRLNTDACYYYECALVDVRKGLVVMAEAPVSQEATLGEIAKFIVKNPQFTYIVGSTFGTLGSNRVQYKHIGSDLMLEIHRVDSAPESIGPIRGASIFSDRKRYEELLYRGKNDERAFRRLNQNELYQIFSGPERAVIGRLLSNLSPNGEWAMIKLLEHVRQISFLKFIQVVYKLFQYKIRSEFMNDREFAGNPQACPFAKCVYEQVCEEVGIPVPEFQPHR